MLRYKKFLFIALLCFAVTGCAYFGYLKQPFEDLPNFHLVSEGFYRGGQPKQRGFERLREMGIRTIIDLRGDNGTLQREKAFAEKYGIEFMHMPMVSHKAPTDAQVLKFLGIVTNPDKLPVFVHCYFGRNRTGTMVAVYRVVVEGWTIKDVYKEAKSLGFWPYYGDAEQKKFIHQLKDKRVYFEMMEARAE